jgi:hypothetical protein
MDNDNKTYRLSSSLFLRLENLAISEKLSLYIFHNNPNAYYSVNAGISIPSPLFSKVLKYFEVDENEKSYSLLSLGRILEKKSQKLPILNASLKYANQSLVAHTYSVQNLEKTYITLIYITAEPTTASLDSLFDRILGHSTTPTTS